MGGTGFIWVQLSGSLKIPGVSWLTEELLASHKGPWSMYVVSVFGDMLWYWYFQLPILVAVQMRKMCRQENEYRRIHRDFQISVWEISISMHLEGEKLKLQNKVGSWLCCTRDIYWATATVFYGTSLWRYTWVCS